MEKILQCIVNIFYIIEFFEAPAICKPGDVSINGECRFIETLPHYHRNIVMQNQRGSWYGLYVSEVVTICVWFLKSKTSNFGEFYDGLHVGYLQQFFRKCQITLTFKASEKRSKRYLQINTNKK
jgi:hypothetical protein